MGNAHILAHASGNNVVESPFKAIAGEVKKGIDSRRGSISSADKGSDRDILQSISRLDAGYESDSTAGDYPRGSTPSSSTTSLVYV